MTRVKTETKVISGKGGFAQAALEKALNDGWKVSHVVKNKTFLTREREVNQPTAKELWRDFLDLFKPVR